MAKSRPSFTSAHHEAEASSHFQPQTKYLMHTLYRGMLTLLKQETKASLPPLAEASSHDHTKTEPQIEHTP